MIENSLKECVDICVDVSSIYRPAHYSTVRWKYSEGFICRCVKSITYYSGKFINFVCDTHSEFFKTRIITISWKASRNEIISRSDYNFSNLVDSKR
jgi:hypothetical protein